MRRLLTALALLVPSAALAEPPDPAVLLELSRARRLREASTAPQPAKPTPVVRTSCGCARTGDCLCYKGECECRACGLGSGGTPTQAGKLRSATTQTIPALGAGTPQPPGAGPGSSAGTSPEVTSTPVPAAASPGTTSGCASGQCSSGRVTYSRGFFRRW